MCGRYALGRAIKELISYFDLELEEPFEIAPRYNIAPTEDAPVIIGANGTRMLQMMRWGFVAPWVPSPEEAKVKPINARADKIATSKLFAPSLKKRRCVVPATGFYEWKGPKGARQPYYFFPKGAPFFGLAGLWSYWKSRDAGDDLYSFTIVTTGANELVRELHDRMPVILDGEGLQRWLDPALDSARGLEPLLRPFPPEKMDAYPVSQDVNRAGFESPECIQPIHPD